jgi:hypothetical protein
VPSIVVLNGLDDNHACIALLSPVAAVRFGR